MLAGKRKRVTTKGPEVSVLGDLGVVDVSLATNPTGEDLLLVGAGVASKSSSTGHSRRNHEVAYYNSMIYNQLQGKKWEKKGKETEKENETRKRKNRLQLPVASYGEL